MYYNVKGIASVEEADQCWTCLHFNTKKLCPLLEALAYEVVELVDQPLVTNCSFYNKKLSISKEKETVVKNVIKFKKSKGDDNA